MQAIPSDTEMPFACLTGSELSRIDQIKVLPTHTWRVSDGIPSKPSRKVESMDYTAYTQMRNLGFRSGISKQTRVMGGSAIEVQTRWQFRLMASGTEIMVT